MNIDIKTLVDRFLGWKLPKDFSPDAGISFTATKPYEGDEYGNSWWPVGTNLFTADQAKAMFEYVLADYLKSSNAPQVPEGFVLVPKEPPTMLSDDDWLMPIRDEFNGSVCDWAKIDDIYKAMIVAAPQPEQKG